MRKKSCAHAAGSRRQRQIADAWLPRLRACGLEFSADASNAVPSSAAKHRGAMMEIVKQDLTVKTGSENMPCDIARPASGGPYPGLVVVMEAFGLNGNIRAISDRFAAEGFAVISPNLYFRSPDNVVGYDNLPGAIKLMGSLTDDQIAA